ncbi:hypothetical protein AB0K80_04350 [Streptomyces sp. NPDC052682]|uniref:hypothetical protein n=1 Tax=Streptomyces sp. NPDC052682 TaxID=3154954 RepID=UPI00341B9E2F
MSRYGRDRAGVHLPAGGVLAALRAEGYGGAAEDAIDDTLTFVPFRKLPRWFKWRWLVATVRDAVQGWWFRVADVAADAWGVWHRSRD